jgi:hypothetical protein
MKKLLSILFVLFLTATAVARDFQVNTTKYCAVKSKSKSYHRKLLWFLQKTEFNGTYVCRKR